MKYSESLNAYIFNPGTTYNGNISTISYLAEDNRWECYLYYLTYNDGEHGQLPVVIKPIDILSLSVNISGAIDEGELCFASGLEEQFWNNTVYTTYTFLKNDNYAEPSIEEFLAYDYVFYQLGVDKGKGKIAEDAEISIVFNLPAIPVTRKMKMKKVDGTFEEVFLGANAQYVTLKNGDTLEDVLNWTEV